jgi:hypothetical protein
MRGTQQQESCLDGCTYYVIREGAAMAATSCVLLLTIARIMRPRSDAVGAESHS